MLQPLFRGSCELFIHRLSGLFSSYCSRPNLRLRRRNEKQVKIIRIKIESNFPPFLPVTPKRSCAPSHASLGGSNCPSSHRTLKSHFMCLDFRTKVFSRGNFHSCCRLTPEGARSLPRLCCLKRCWKLTFWALSLNVFLTFPF